MASSAPVQFRTRVVAVGDVHGQWDEQDAKALECLEPGVQKGHLASALPIPLRPFELHLNEANMCRCCSLCRGFR